MAMKAAPMLKAIEVPILLPPIQQVILLKAGTLFKVTEVPIISPLCERALLPGIIGLHHDYIDTSTVKCNVYCYIILL